MRVWYRREATPAKTDNALVLRARCLSLVLGYVGDTASEGFVHLHLELRRARDGIDVRALAPERLLLPQNSVVCDPRNVLPLR